MQPAVVAHHPLVPLFVVDKVVQRIKDGTITRYIYDLNQASFVEVRPTSDRASCPHDVSGLAQFLDLSSECKQEKVKGCTSGFS